VPADQSLRRLSDVLNRDPVVNVVVASEQNVDDGAVIQRLNLTDGLAADFLTAARKAVPESLDEVRLRPYEAGYMADPNELLYLELENEADVALLTRQLSHVQQAEIFRERDEIVDHLKFYAIVASPSARHHAVFLRAYSPKKELTRRAGFAALFSRGTYDKIDTKIFLFDYGVDCFAWDGYLYIRHVSAFQLIFKYFEQLRIKADETVDEVSARIPISNLDEFRAACTGQMQMMSKLAQIARKPYLPTVTINDIRRTIREFRLDVRIVREDGQDKLLFEQSPQKRWLILKLLDDDFLGSVMTNQKYEVNSKSALRGQ
jgi:hypothetical protein